MGLSHIIPVQDLMWNTCTKYVHSNPMTKNNKMALKEDSPKTHI